MDNYTLKIIILVLCIFLFSKFFMKKIIILITKFLLNKKNKKNNKNNMEDNMKDINNNLLNNIDENNSTTSMHNNNTPLDSSQNRYNIVVDYEKDTSQQPIFIEHEKHHLDTLYKKIKQTNDGKTIVYGKNNIIKDNITENMYVFLNDNGIYNINNKDSDYILFFLSRITNKNNEIVYEKATNNMFTHFFYYTYINTYENIRNLEYYYYDTAIIYEFEIQNWKFKWYYTGDENFIAVHCGAIVYLNLLETFFNNYCPFDFDIKNCNNIYSFMQNAYIEKTITTTSAVKHINEISSIRNEKPHIILINNNEDAVKNTNYALNVLGITCYDINNISITNNNYFIIELKINNKGQINENNDSLYKNPVQDTCAFSINIQETPIFIIYYKDMELNILQKQIHEYFSNYNIPAVMNFNNNNISIISYGLLYTNLIRIEIVKHESIINNEIYFLFGCIEQLIKYIPDMVKNKSMLNTTGDEIEKIVVGYIDKQQIYNNPKHKNLELKIKGFKHIINNYIYEPFDSADMLDIVSTNHNYPFNIVIEHNYKYRQINILILKDLSSFDGINYNDNIFFASYNNFINQLKNKYDNFQEIEETNTYGIIEFTLFED